MRVREITAWIQDRIDQLENPSSRDEQSPAAEPVAGASAQG
jgi:hypothetical protein